MGDSRLVKLLSAQSNKNPHPVGLNSEVPQRGVQRFLGVTLSPVAL